MRVRHPDIHLHTYTPRQPYTRSQTLFVMSSTVSVHCVKNEADRIASHGDLPACESVCECGKHIHPNLNPEPNRHRHCGRGRLQNQLPLYVWCADPRTPIIKHLKTHILTHPCVDTLVKQYTCASMYPHTDMPLYSCTFVVFEFGVFGKQK